MNEYFCVLLYEILEKEITLVYDKKCEERSMKKNKVGIVLGLCIVLGVIGLVIYFTYGVKQEDKQGNIDVKYEKTNMITNFRLGMAKYDSINPHVTQNKDMIQIASLIFEPLLTITQDYRLENCLAKEWSKVSNKSYIIKLKENVKWQDNSDFTAEDVKFTIEEIQKNKKSIYLENVKDIQKIEVVDNYTIRLELKKEIPFWEYRLIFPIISKKQYEGKDIAKSKELPIGTGKYKITRLDKEVIELTKNENWYNIEKEDSNIKTITISLYQDMGEVYNSFKLGNIDLVHTSNPKYEEYIGSMGYQKKQYPGREYDYLAFNCTNAVIQNVEVRQAIQKAIDKGKIVSSVLEEKAYIANFPLDYGHYLTKDLEWGEVFNPEEANKILKDNGWRLEYGIWYKVIEGRTRALSFTITVQEKNERRIKVAEEIKKQLETIGIQITIQKVSDSDYKKILANHQYEILLTGVYNGYGPELNGFLGEGNLANYENTQIDTLLKEVSTMSSEDLQKEAYRKIVETWRREVPYLGLYRNQAIVAYGQSVRGDVTPNNYSILYQFSQWYRQ